MQNFFFFPPPYLLSGFQLTWSFLRDKTGIAIKSDVRSCFSHPLMNAIRTSLLGLSLSGIHDGLEITFLLKLYQKLTFSQNFLINCHFLIKLILEKILANYNSNSLPLTFNFRHKHMSVCVSIWLHTYKLTTLKALLINHYFSGILVLFSAIGFFPLIFLFNRKALGAIDAGIIN